MQENYSDAIRNREHLIRCTFSFFAASTLLYMAAENADLMISKKQPLFFIPMMMTALLAIHEGWKVGDRVERILGLRR